MGIVACFCRNHSEGIGLGEISRGGAEIAEASNRRRVVATEVTASTDLEGSRQSFPRELLGDLCALM